MKNIITVLLSVLIATLIGQAPALKNSAVHHVTSVKPTVLTVTTTAAVQPQPEKIETYANGCSTYDPIFRLYVWDVRTAEAICQAESGGNVTAMSWTCDRGLMQINCIHSDMVDGNLSSLFTPSTNIAVAYQIYSANGWRPWTTFNTGAYARFL